MMSGIQEASYILRVGVSKEENPFETQGIHYLHHFCFGLLSLKGTADFYCNLSRTEPVLLSGCVCMHTFVSLQSRTGESWTMVYIKPKYGW